jgi:hypothetical protein
MRRTVICILGSLSVAFACDRSAPPPDKKTTETKPTETAPVVTPANAAHAKAPTPANTELGKLELDVVPKLEGAESMPITLSASGKCSNGEPVSFAWLQVGGGPRVALATPYAAETKFNAPEASRDYDMQFELRATAHGARDAVRLVDVHVYADDDPPTAEAFVPAPAECGDTVALVGQGRSAETDQALTFAWKQVGDGPRVVLDGADRSQATFVVPDTGGVKTLSFELHVFDGSHPDVVAPTHVDVTCDPAFAALAAGEVRKLERVDAKGAALPRGKWELTGALKLTAADESKPAVATMRFEYGARVAGIVTLTVSNGAGSLRMSGVQRDTDDGPWYEPAITGRHDLGPWAIDQPLGFSFEWDGHELGLHFGPPGEREKWPESPYPITFPFASRPRTFVLATEGGQSSVSDLQLTGR